ncbi:MAG TPA: preprotein translocase subunit SecE [Patescibacteria group bacterium]|nr:preprotein translocase subunit SecE [Patescibacteria group bacterium]
MSSLVTSLAPIKFLTEVIGELKVVTWPTPKEALRSAAIVIAISIVVGAYIALLDLLFSKGIALLITTK